MQLSKLFLSSPWLLLVLFLSSAQALSLHEKLFKKSTHLFEPVFLKVIISTKKPLRIKILPPMDDELIYKERKRTQSIKGMTAYLILTYQVYPKKEGRLKISPFKAQGVPPNAPVGSVRPILAKGQTLFLKTMLPKNATFPYFASAGINLQRKLLAVSSEGVLEEITLISKETIVSQLPRDLLQFESNSFSMKTQSIHAKEDAHGAKLQSTIFWKRKDEVQKTTQKTLPQLKLSYYNIRTKRMEEEVFLGSKITLKKESQKPFWQLQGHQKMTEIFQEKVRNYRFLLWILGLLLSLFLWILVFHAVKGKGSKSIFLSQHFEDGVKQFKKALQEKNYLNILKWFPYLTKTILNNPHNKDTLTILKEWQGKDAFVFKQGAKAMESLCFDPNLNFQERNKLHGQLLKLIKIIQIKRKKEWLLSAFRPFFQIPLKHYLKPKKVYLKTLTLQKKD